MEQYSVTGMSCAACSARVEKAVSKVEGVTSCSVNLLTNSMGVEGNAKPAEVINAVINAGYGASLKGSENKRNTKGAPLGDTETPVLIKRLVASLGFLAVLMYISMGAHMLGLPLLPFLEKNIIAQGLTQMLLALGVMIINQKFFINGFKGLIHRAPNMDTLVAMGSGAAFVYSTYTLFALSEEVISGAIKHSGAPKFYFESAAMILALITVGKMLEAKSKGKTVNALKGLMDLSPKTATIIKNGEEINVAIENVQKEDIFVCRPGDNIPVDGVIIEGITAIDESALTGESVPAEKTVGSTVFGATINKSGFIKCKATKVGEDTALSQIIKTVEGAAATKAPIAKVADKVSGVFVPIVITIALITVAIWLLVGENVGFALQRGISVLVISCPCALGLATPVAITVASGIGAKNGILFKTAASLEEAGRAELVVLDKTGTVTKGTPTVTDIIPAEGVTEDALIKVAASLEAKSEHPFARAIVKNAKEKEISLAEVSSFYALAGSGITGIMGGFSVFGGKFDFIKDTAVIPKDILNRSDELAADGKTPLFFSGNGNFFGIIALADTVKEDSREAVARLKNMGIKTVMLTGDNEKTAAAIAQEVGIDEVIAGVLPGEKEELVRKYKKQGKTVMVGDGINDAPALTTADLGIAIGAGTDIAIDSAEAVLMQSRLSDVPAAIALGRATLKNIRQNLFWAFIYNSIGIPVAAGAFIHAFNLELSPMLGAAAMSLSSFCVVTNALRLNLINIHDPKKDKLKKQKKKPMEEPKAEIPNEPAFEEKCGEEKLFEETYTVEGMMCAHCEAKVKTAIMGVEGVTKVNISLLNNSATVEARGKIKKEDIVKAVENAGYRVI